MLKVAELLSAQHVFRYRVLLEKAGFATPDEALAHRTDLPVGMHYCHAKKLTEKEKRGKSPQTDDEFLRAALILGLCGPSAPQA